MSDEDSVFDQTNMNLLLHVIKTTADTAWTLADLARSKANSINPVWKPDTEYMVNLLKLATTTADAAFAVAEAASPRAASITANDGLRRENAGQGSTPAAGATTWVRIPYLDPQRSIVLDGGPFVINERVGTISSSVWQGISEDCLSNLDRSLKGIINKQCRPTYSWGQKGTEIQEELAKCGFKFATAAEVAQHPQWGFVIDINASHKSRIDNTVYYCQQYRQGDWYADDMIRIVQTLVHLRGI